jgi:hypothetical protein
VKAAHNVEIPLKQKHVPYEVKIYPHPGHGLGPHEKDGQERVAAFLERYLSKWTGG